MKNLLKMVMLLGLVASKTPIFALGGVPGGAPAQSAGTASGTPAQSSVSSSTTTTTKTQAPGVLSQGVLEELQSLDKHYQRAFYDLNMRSLFLALEYRINFCLTMIDTTTGDEQFAYLEELKKWKRIQEDEISRSEDREELRWIRDKLMLKFVTEVEVAKAQEEAFMHDDAQGRGSIEQEEAALREKMGTKVPTFNKSGGIARRSR